PCTPALTNNTGPGFGPATEITGRGSSFANAAPGNLIRCRCVVPGVSSPKIGMFERMHEEIFLRNTGKQEGIFNVLEGSCVLAFLGYHCNPLGKRGEES